MSTKLIFINSFSFKTSTTPCKYVYIHIHTISYSLADWRIACPMTTPPLATAILVLGPPLVFKAYETEFSEKFNFLKPWKTPLPLHQFIATHSCNVRAIFCSAVSPVTAEIIQSLPELRFVLASSIGVNHIDLRECKRRGIVVANAGSTFSEDVADMAVGLLIDVVKRISAGNRLVKARVWPRQGDYPLTHKVCYIYMKELLQQIF
ncbi:putative oxidoreductase [Helianthus annuus]|nr:putative oxidoreductase [Helianthus annuus]